MMRRLLVLAMMLWGSENALAASRFYLSNAAADKTLPTVQGTWTNSANALANKLDVKAGAAATQASPTSSNTGDNMMIGRWETLPLSADASFATTDTVQYVVGAVASSITNTTLNFRVHIFVIQSDAATVRGTLLTNFTGAGTAWTATATGRTDSTQNLSNNVSAKAGDRIVVEIGYHRSGSSTSNRTGTFNYGNTGATDLTSTNTNVTTQPGWVEWSNTFTTAAGAAPTVTTSAATSITSTAATGNGNVTLDNGFPITERGICWATTSNPTTANSKATASGTTGAYTASITGLTANTVYHNRAYAINAQGTSYGADNQFTSAAATGNMLMVF